MNAIILDVEATGKTNAAKTYDVGFAAVNLNNGEILATCNFVVDEIFYNQYLMKNAYYAEKVPQYYDDIKVGLREVRNFANVRANVLTFCKEYKVKAIWAFNAFYDMNALNFTSNLLLGQDFIPAEMGVEFRCIMGAFMSTIAKSKNYMKFAEKTDAGNVRVNAENAYRYITKNEAFVEEHTGLADALIELEILLACLKYKKKMDTTPKTLFEFPAYHEIQKRYKEMVAA